MLPQRMRDTMELLRQILAVGVDAAEMTAKLDETVERMESRNSIVHRVTGAQARARSHRCGPPRSPQRRFPYSREPSPQRVEQRMERERSSNVHRVSLRRAAATGATAGMERYVKPQPPAPAPSSQPSARSDSQHILLNYQEDRIAFWEATQMEAKDKPGGGLSQGSAAFPRRLAHPWMADTNTEMYARVAERFRRNRLTPSKANIEAKNAKGRTASFAVEPSSGRTSPPRKKDCYASDAP